MRHENPAIRVVIKKKRVDPANLVAYAVRLRDNDADSFEEVWCVVDVDDFDLEPAVTLAARESILLAVSNPCFEAWLVLHFANQTAPLTCYAEAERVLRRFVPDYCKSRLDFGRYVDGVDRAVERARKLAEPGQEHVTNPASGVWPLVRKFDRSV